jgi:hypothetical protein
MASYTIAATDLAVHDKVLVANTADTVTIAANANNVEILSDGSAALYFTVDGTTPTVSGSHCYKIPSGNSSAMVMSAVLPAGVAIKLISTGTPTYSVMVLG